MNKLSRASVYQLAIQGRNRKHWDKVYGVYPKIQETRTPWKEWIEYELDTSHANQPNPWWSVSSTTLQDTSWEIMVFKNHECGVTCDSIYADLRNPAQQAKSADYQHLMGFIMDQGPRVYPELISETHWLRDFVHMTNQQALHPYRFYISKDGLPRNYAGHMVWIRKPEDLDDYLAKVEPETLRLVVQTLEASCLDFYPLPVLQVLKRARELGIKCSL